MKMKHIVFGCFILLLGSTGFAIDGTLTTFKGGLSSDSVRTSALELNGSQTIDDDLSVASHVTLGTTIDSVSKILMVIRNKDGASLLKGDVVEWDSTEIYYEKIKPQEISLGSDSTFVDISDEGGPVSLRLTVTGTADAAGDTTRIYGDVFGSSTTSELLTLTNTASMSLSSAYFWNSIDSISCRGLDGSSVDSLQFYIWSLCGVVSAITSTTERVMGIVTDATIADNAVGYVAVKGRVQADAEVETGNAMVPGSPLIVNLRGNLTNERVYDLGAGTIQIDTLNITVGHSLQYYDGRSADSQLIWIDFAPK